MNIPLIDNFREVQNYSHIISKHSTVLGYSYHFNSLLFIPKVCTLSGINLADPPSTNACFLDKFEKELKETYYIFTDGSKSPEFKFTGFAFTTRDDLSYK